MAEPSRKILTRPASNKTKPQVSKEQNKPKTPEPETLQLKNDSLAFSLSGAAQTVAYVLEGVALPQALSRVFTQMNATPQARGAMQDISYRTMRQVGRVDA